MAGYIVFDSWPSKLSQKDQLVALGCGGSAMPLEGACAESFASLCICGKHCCCVGFF